MYVVRVSRMSSQMTSSTRRKAAKRGRKPKSIRLRKLARHGVLHICAESIPKVLALFNYNEREPVLYRRIFILGHVLEFCIQKVLRCLSKTSRNTSSFVDKTIERTLSSFISSICFKVSARVKNGKFSKFLISRR